MIDFKMVDGELVALSEAEIAERNEREEAWNAAAAERALVSLRAQRDILLAQSDIYVLPDRWDSYTSIQKTQWATYRQALRDLPDNIADPLNPEWPVKPT